MNNLRKFATEAEYTAATIYKPSVSLIASNMRVIFDQVMRGDLKMVYEVTNTSTYTTLCSNIQNISQMWIDGVEITPRVSYIFATAGKHKVEFKLNTDGINNYQFWGIKSLISVEVGSGITNCYANPFMQCDNLASIVVDKNNTAYDSRNNCNAIINKSSNTLIGGCKNTVIPNDVETIGSSAFYECTGLTSIDIPNSVTSIGEEAFNGCTSLSSIALGGVNDIGYNAFQNCGALTEISLDGVTSIGQSAFYGAGLTSVTIPSSVRTLGDGAFENCNNLTNVEIEASWLDLGNSTFRGCFNLTSVTMPSSVNYLGDTLFSDCRSLTNINIPNSVTSIGEEAFRTCGLTALTIPDSVTRIGSAAFENCNNLSSVIVEATTIPSLGFYAFDMVNDCPIYVPCDCEVVSAYKQAEVWRDYGYRIKGMQQQGQPCPCGSGSGSGSGSGI